jgi:hypothetical protein
MISRLISLYKKAQNDIKNSSSGKTKFNIVLSFFSECETVFKSAPPFSLIKDFLSILLDVILRSDINFTDPSKLNSAKYILNESKKEFVNVKGGEMIISQINKAEDILNMQILKSLFYLGKYDDGLIVLNNMLMKKDTFFEDRDENPKPDKKQTPPSKSNKYAIVNPDFYKESKAYEILSEIKNELDRLNSYSDTNINILLVEQEKINPDSNGTIQNLICRTIKTRNTKDARIEFENITDLEDSSLEDTLNDIRISSNKGIKTIYGRAAAPNIRRVLRFQNLKGIYKGASLGLGAVVISICNYFNFINCRKRYKISNAAAFTGVVQSDGKVIKVNSESVRNKIEAAFFSWVKYCIVPKENIKDASDAYDNLKQLYPEKNMTIIGVDNVGEIFKNEDIVKHEKINLREYSVSLYNRHRIVSIAAMLLITATAAFFAANRFLPKDIKPLPNTVNSISLIYAPDRDNNWIFRNSNYFGGDTIDFGDVAIGDQWFPHIEFRNNGRKPEEFNIYIDGKDKDEFELLYLYSNEQPDAPGKIYPEFPQDIYLKFVPVKNEGKKSAVLVLENKETKSRKQIYLKGEAKRLSKGYCVEIEDVDDEIVLEPNTNLIEANTSLSFWIKPIRMGNEIDEPIFRIDNNPFSNNKLKVFVQSIDSTIGIAVYGSKSREAESFMLNTYLKFDFNEWNYFALSFSDTSMSVVLNETVKTFKMQKNMLRKLNDYIYFGRLNPDEINTAPVYKSNLTYLLDEFRIYNKALTPGELKRNRFDLDYRRDALAAGYSFDDATPNKAFDNSNNDFWPKFLGGVKRRIDKSQPFDNSYKEKANGNGKNVIFCRDKKGFLKFNKNIFQPKSSFTFQCDFRVDESAYQHRAEFFPSWYFINRADLDFNFENFYDSIKVINSDKYKNSFVLKYIYKPDITGKPVVWHRYTLTYDVSKNEFRFYIDSNLAHTEIPAYPVDITQNYMGIAFSIANYYGSPRFTTFKSYIDNIKLFNTVLSPQDIYSDSRNGLLAYWAFQRTDKELAFDEISNLPLLMWKPFELVEDDTLN